MTKIANSSFLSIRLWAILPNFQSWHYSKISTKSNFARLIEIFKDNQTSFFDPWLPIALSWLSVKIWDFGYFLWNRSIKVNVCVLLLIYKAYWWLIKVLNIIYTSQKLHVLKKSTFCLFLRLYCLFGIVGVFSHYARGDAGI